MSKQTSKLDLKIHPPYIAGISVAIAYLMNRIEALRVLDFKLGYVPVVVLFVLGGLSGLAGLAYFYKHKTTFDPANPHKSKKLVTNGVYKITRNPMYLGLLLIIIGCVLFFGNIASFLGPIFFVWYITNYQIKPEERILSDKFGTDYAEYLNKTRRWV